jgi:hypothetical protein
MEDREIAGYLLRRINDCRDRSEAVAEVLTSSRNNYVSSTIKKDKATLFDGYECLHEGEVLLSVYKDLISDCNSIVSQKFKLRRSMENFRNDLEKH